MDQFLKTFENFDNNLNLSIVLAILIVLVSIGSFSTVIHCLKSLHEF